MTKLTLEERVTVNRITNGFIEKDRARVDALITSVNLTQSILDNTSVDEFPELYEAAFTRKRTLQIKLLAAMDVEQRQIEDIRDLQMEMLIEGQK